MLHYITCIYVKQYHLHPQQNKSKSPKCFCTMNAATLAWLQAFGNGKKSLTLRPIKLIKKERKKKRS